MSGPWRIAVGADEAGLALKDSLADLLRADPRVATVTDFGVTEATDTRPYSEVGLAVGQAVADGSVDRALMVCGTGIGVAVAANKVRGVRATVAHDSYSLQRSVLSNNCQVVTMGARVIGPELAKLLVREWLALEFDESSPSADKVAVISRYESGR